MTIELVIIFDINIQKSSSYHMQIHLTFYYCDCKCKLTIAKTRPKILHSNANGSKNAMSCHVVVYGDTSFSHVARSVMRMHTNLEYQNFMSMLMMVDVLSAYFMSYVEYPKLGYQIFLLLP